MSYSIPKGVFDILPKDPNQENQWKNSDRWQFVEKIIRETCAIYGCKEIRTPIFEKTELFIRGVGEGSDIVSKEMYTFSDKGDRSMTLRPEGTASIMRAFVENKLYAQGNLHKLFYIGPMFRYERPQAGRYRQHHQFGAEAIGNEKPEQDAEIIDLLCEVYRKLGIKNLKVCINSVGDSNSRTNFSEALRQFLEPKYEMLSEDSKKRFHKNMLRILDSKDPNDQKILDSAPSILDYLNEESKEHFSKVCSLLNTIGISYEVSPKLVRGLDYYNKTVFEIVSSDLGAQNSIGGGGRYDGLTKLIGGPNLPSVGFGTGIERLLQTMEKQGCLFPKPPHPFVFIIPMGEDAKSFCFKLCNTLRKKSVPCELDYSNKKVSSSLQQAVSLGSEYCLIIGEQELNTKKVVLKNLESREQTEIGLESLVESLLNLSKPQQGSQ